MNQYNPYKTASYNMTELYIAWVMSKVELDELGVDAPLERINAVNRFYGDLHHKDEQIRGAMKSLKGTAVITLNKDSDLMLFQRGRHDADDLSDPFG